LPREVGPRALEPCDLAICRCVVPARAPRRGDPSRPSEGPRLPGVLTRGSVTHPRRPLPAVDLDRFWACASRWPTVSATVEVAVLAMAIPLRVDEGRGRGRTVGPPSCPSDILREKTAVPVRAPMSSWPGEGKDDVGARPSARRVTRARLLPRRSIPAPVLIRGGGPSCQMTAGAGWRPLGAACRRRRAWRRRCSVVMFERGPRGIAPFETVSDVAAASVHLEDRRLLRRVVFFR